MSLRNWNLPPGVDPGTWDYVSSKSIADDYENYFQDHPLFAVDHDVLNQCFGNPSVDKIIADFGCGTGRALLPQIERGFSGVGIDLSLAMLKQVCRLAAERQVSVDCVQANLVEMEAIATDSFHHGMCLFSTLGMIKGRLNRRKALSEFSRVIKPDGSLVLHIHNYWYNLFDPGGPWWLIRNRIQSFWDGNTERGDKHYPYRGLSNMFLHVFTQSEIRADLKFAGWNVKQLLPLKPVTLQPWEGNAAFKSIRTVGWIIVCDQIQ